MLIFAIIASSIIFALVWGQIQYHRGVGKGKNHGLSVGFASGFKEGRRLEKTARRILAIRRWAMKNASSILTLGIDRWSPEKKCPICNGTVTTRQ